MISIRKAIIDTDKSEEIIKSALCSKFDNNRNNDTDNENCFFVDQLYYIRFLSEKFTIENKPANYRDMNFLMLLGMIKESKKGNRVVLYIIPSYAVLIFVGVGSLFLTIGSIVNNEPKVMLIVIALLVFLFFDTFFMPIGKLKEVLKRIEEKLT